MAAEPWGSGASCSRGSELVAAESWLARQGGKQPPPTEAQAELVLASRQASTRRLRGLVATLAGGPRARRRSSPSFAFVQRQSAIDREQTARARELATSAVSQLGEDPALAVTLAAEAVRTKWTRPSWTSCARRWPPSRERAVRRVDGITDVEFDPTGRFLATAGDRGVQLWRLPAFAVAPQARSRRCLRGDVRAGTAGRSSRRGTSLRGSGPWTVVQPCEWRMRTRRDRLQRRREDRRDGDVERGARLGRRDEGAACTLALRGRERPEFSPDGRLIAIRSQFAVRIWDWAGGRRR